MPSQPHTYPVPVVRLVVADSDGRVLLLRRALGTHRGGSWCLPGGKVDYGDSLEGAIARELAEETSLICQSSRFLFLQDGLPPEPGAMHCLNLYFECRATGEPAINEESSEFAWVGRDELPAYEIVFGGADAITRYWDGESWAGQRQRAMVLDGAALRQLLELGRYRRIAANEILIREDSPGECAYVLLSGRCKVSIHGEVIAHIEPVDIFGCTAALANAPRTATVTGVEACDVIEIPRATLEHLLLAQPAVMAAFFHRLLRRNRDTSHWSAVARADFHGLQAAQQQLLPPAALLRAMSAVTVEVQYEPCMYASGDYYDAIPLSPTRTLFVVGDAIGHGPKAAMIMAIARSQIHELSKTFSHPEEIVGALDRHFRELGTLAETSGYLMTMVAVVLDSNSRTVEYCVAGHPAPFLHRAGVVTDLTSNIGPLLGMPALAGVFVRGEANLEPGDTILFYTDGAFELLDDHDAGREILDREGLRDMFRRIAADVPLRAIPEAMARTIAALRSGRPAADDLTLLLVHIP